MSWRMCNISVSEPSEEIRDRLGINDIETILKWYCIGKCKSLEVDGTAGKERPRKTWNQVAQGDFLALQLGKG